MLIFVVKVEAEDVAGQSIVHSIEAAVARIHVAFDQVREDAQTFGSVDVDLLTVLVVGITEIDGVHDALLQNLDILFATNLRIKERDKIIVAQK